jgi:hypothetical protein
MESRWKRALDGAFAPGYDAASRSDRGSSVRRYGVFVAAMMALGFAAITRPTPLSASWAFSESLAVLTLALLRAISTTPEVETSASDSTSRDGIV